MPYSITEARPAKTHPPCEKRTWGKNRAREKFAYQIPSQALELQQEKSPTATKLVLGVCVYHFGHDLIAIDQRETPLTDWEQHFYSYDGLGSLRALTDSAGQQTDTYTYDAFGIQLAATGTTPNAYRYTGEQFDEDLDQYYLRARYNDPNIGRFWSMDAYEGSNQDPVTLHKYTYGNSNPVSNIDPSGNIGLATITATIPVLNGSRAVAIGFTVGVYTSIVKLAYAVGYLRPLSTELQLLSGEFSRYSSISSEFALKGAQLTNQLLFSVVKGQLKDPIIGGLLGPIYSVESIGKIAYTIGAGISDIEGMVFSRISSIRDRLPESVKHKFPSGIAIRSGSVGLKLLVPGLINPAADLAHLRNGLVNVRTGNLIAAGDDFDRFYESASSYASITR